MKIYKTFIHFIFSLIILSSCKVAERAELINVRPLSTARLINRVEENKSDFDFLTIKRVNCQYEDLNTKANFKAALKSINDSAILISISKLNIPMVSILLDRDSIKYINYHEKNFITADYNEIEGLFDLDLSFEAIRNIINNDIFYYNVNPDNNDFTSYIDSGKYVLQAVKERKIDNKEKIQKILKRTEEESLIFQTIYIDPENFNILKFIIEDKTNEQKVLFTFDDFQDVSGRKYPGTIIFEFNTAYESVMMKLKLSGYTTDIVENLKINIPEKYNRIFLN